MDVNSGYEAVMGLEVHVELNTKSKMFCRCMSEYFGAEPNTHTCPVCLGLPGALPYPNEEAINKCIQIGLALNCQVEHSSRFERKNYFYPDLAKGYQISQLRWPLCVNGFMDIEDGAGAIKRIRINRVHQEEDTGKLTHRSGESFVDFNRSGVPLVEIVTEPDFEDVEQVRNYAKSLQQIFRDLGVSNADMEKGDVRLEVNISVRRLGEKDLPKYRVELKNINSFRFMVKALNYEKSRQIGVLKSGGQLHQETRGWNEEKGETYLQRSKEEANDYRYFPEPDMPQIEVEELKVKEIEASMAKLSHQIIGDYQQKYGLGKEIVDSFKSSPKRLRLFEESLENLSNQEASELAKRLANTPEALLDGVDVDKLLNSIRTKGVSGLSDEELERVCKEVIKENPTGAVEAYKSGKKQAIGVLIGSVIQKTSGKAEAKVVREVLEKLLSE